LEAGISYGHDIEGSWLLYEAALAVGGQSLIAEARRTALEIAEVVYAEAIDRENGGLFSGRDEEGALAPNKEWWPQAEAVVGFYNAFELSGERKYLDATGGIWDFLQTHFTDSEHGEWHYELHPSHAPNPQMPKAGFWKCPYHNARACFEIMRRMK
jgi:mannobiose 2-epimerase